MSDSSDNESVEFDESFWDDKMFSSARSRSKNRSVDEAVARLISLRDEIDWKFEVQRLRLHEVLNFLVSRRWRGESLREIFTTRQIELLIWDSAVRMLDKNCARETASYPGACSIDFFVDTARYRHEPELVDEGAGGRPTSRGLTLLHQMARLLVTNQIYHKFKIVAPLFRLYDRYDVNYTDEDGLTHFHVACMAGLDKYAKKFLPYGPDLDCVWRETGETPLHLALRRDHREVSELLLRTGADPNLPDERGETALHIVCWKKHIDLAKVLFEVSAEKNRPVRLDARDEEGRTALELAVANLSPDLVDLLLDHGADLSSFVFPTLENFNEALTRHLTPLLARAAGIMAVVERLESRGHELDPSHAMVVVQFFVKHELFSRGSESTCNGEEFARDAQRFTVLPRTKYGSGPWQIENNETRTTPRLSLDDLIRLPPEEAEQVVKYKDYVVLSRSDLLIILNQTAIVGRHWRACQRLLCEKLSRKFFLSWALYPFWELIRYRLPIELCKYIIDELENEDLCNILLANESMNNENKIKAI